MSADQKIKTAAGKPPLAMLPLWTLVGTARVFEYGARKYAPGNWALASDRGAPERYLSAALRHLMSLQDNPLALDTESGLPHLDHALCSLAMLRGLLVRYHGMPADPGQGAEPPERPRSGE